METKYEKQLREWRERRLAIYTERKMGLSLNEIGRKHKISATSVMRIIARYEKEIEKSKE